MSTNGRGAAVKNLAAATSASTSGRGVNVNHVVATASASTSERGVGVDNGGAAASAAPADQFPYHVVVQSEAYSLLMTWFYRHKHSSSRWFQPMWLIWLKVMMIKSQVSGEALKMFKVNERENTISQLEGTWLVTRPFLSWPLCPLFKFQGGFLHYCGYDWQIHALAWLTLARTVVSVPVSETLWANDYCSFLFSRLKNVFYDPRAVHCCCQESQRCFGLNTC